MNQTYEYNGENYAIKLDRNPDGTLQAVIGDNTYTVHASQLPDGGYLLRINGQRIIAHSTTDAYTRYVHLNGTQYQLNKVDARRRKRGAAAGGGDLTAEMPGQVMEVRVAVGDAVTHGDVLVVLEAMKMEIRVVAPHDGIVEALHVNTGDIVERGQHLVDISEEE